MKHADVSNDATKKLKEGKIYGMNAIMKEMFMTVVHVMVVLMES